MQRVMTCRAVGEGILDWRVNLVILILIFISVTINPYIVDWVCVCVLKWRESDSPRAT